LNNNKIRILDSELCKLEDEENLKLLSNTKYWNLLNHEKPTRFFSDLLKNDKKSDSLDSIVDNNGVNFGNLGNRNQYLVEHFSKLFGTAFKSNFTLEDFLGEDINNPLIEDHKLNEEEKLSLESPITLEELDESLVTSNMSSALGPDGIPVKALKLFWPLLRKPFLLSFNYMASKGELKGLMRYSNIKLIPKGNKNLTQINNWRPISLLASSYKLYSGIISLRLNKVSHRIYKAQKAYSEEYCIHEGLLSTIENISKSINSKTPLGILLVDFSKAFDNLGHLYLRQVLKFFNFGDFFTNLVMTSLNNRMACIQTEEGLTSNFNIRVGALQGDRPSPLLFKWGINPLILKFVLNNEIKIPRALPFNISESARVPHCVSVFADDKNNFFEPKASSLLKCHEILESFSLVSNLKINSSKTKVIVTGSEPTPEFLECIDQLGFNLVESFDVLGLKFDSKLENMEANWDRILKKIHKIRHFWTLFNLSIQGKINVIKTYFFSQLSYLGTILNPSNEFLVSFDSCVITFLNTNQKIAKERIFESIENGGLGLPRAKDFLDSLKVNMFKRSLKNIDTWSLELKACAILESDPLHIDISRINRKNNPVLFNIATAFLKFQHKFLAFKG